MSPHELHETTEVLASLICAAERQFHNFDERTERAIDRARCLLSYLTSQETCYPLGEAASE